MKAHVILLVSSDPKTIRIVEDAVIAERHGFRHIEIREDAIREFASVCGDVDLAILDFDPGIQGLNLFNVARACVPVLVLTHRDVNDMNRILRRHGAGGCLSKPFTAAQLTATIHELLTPQTVAV